MSQHTFTQTLKLTLPNSPNFRARVVHMLLDSTGWWFRPRSWFLQGDEGVGLDYRFFCLFLDTLDQLFTCRNIVNEANDLTSRPDLPLTLAPRLRQWMQTSDLPRNQHPH